MLSIELIIVCKGEEDGGKLVLRLLESGTEN